MLVRPDNIQYHLAVRVTNYGYRTHIAYTLAIKDIEALTLLAEFRTCSHIDISLYKN